jgi:hypothetical protein
MGLLGSIYGVAAMHFAIKATDTNGKVSWVGLHDHVGWRPLGRLRTAARFERREDAEGAIGRMPGAFARAFALIGLQFEIVDAASLGKWRTG